MANPETIRQIKSTLNLVDIVGETVQLKRAGARYKGLSPFKQERTPSFYVDPNTQLFYCFSTNQGGDLVDFIMLTQGKNFREALEWLAERAGVRLESKAQTPEDQERERREQAERKMFLKLNRFAAHFFQNQFLGAAGTEARAYADRRGLTKHTLEAYAIGYAPDSWNALRDYLIGVKAPLLKAVELGLLRVRNEEKPREDGANLYDTFRNRLMFPIRDAEGEIAGFGGRWLGADGADTAKYMNSPESPLYNKSRMLFNLDRARKAIREKECVVLVEGYMDCIALDQAGISYGVATLGTALSSQHVQILRRLSQKVVCLYDADAAGQRATERNMDLFLEELGYPLLGARLPEGKDPDEFLRTQGASGKEALEKIIENAPALVDAWTEKRIQTTPPALQARTDTLERIAKKLSLLRDELWIKARLPDLAKGLGMDRELVWEAIMRQKQPGLKAKTAPKPPQNPAQKSPLPAEKTKKLQGQSAKTKFGFERHFMRAALVYPDWLPSLRNMHSTDPGSILPFVAEPEVAQSLAFLLRPLETAETEQDRLGGLLELIRADTPLRSLVAQAQLERSADNSAAGMLEDALTKLRQESLQRRKQEIRAQIHEAEARGDFAACERLQQELSALARGQQVSI